MYHVKLKYEHVRTTLLIITGKNVLRFTKKRKKKKKRTLPRNYELNKERQNENKMKISKINKSFNLTKASLSNTVGETI